MKVECHITRVLATLNPGAPDQYVRLSSSHTEPLQMHIMQFFIYLISMQTYVNYGPGNLFNYKLVFLC